MLKYKLAKCRSIRKSERILNKHVKDGWKLEKMVVPVANEGYVMVFSRDSGIKTPAVITKSQGVNATEPSVTEEVAVETEEPKTTLTESI